jgi:hypothetical protein
VIKYIYSSSKDGYEGNSSAVAKAKAEVRVPAALQPIDVIVTPTANYLKFILNLTKATSHKKVLFELDKLVQVMKTTTNLLLWQNRILIIEK